MGDRADEDRVVVFVDYENMSRSAMEAFGGQGHFWPWNLGELLTARRNAHRPSRLHQVRVYRGLPGAREQPRSNAANQAQTAAWRASCPDEPALVVYHRPLRYPSGWPTTAERPQEKGVDVALAVDLVQMAYQGAYDIGIICSHDSDLTPALDTVKTVQNWTRVEVASWARRARIGFSGARETDPWCHWLNRDDFLAVEDASTYP